MSFNNNFSQDDYFRSNPNLKSPTYKQFISKETFDERYKQLKLIFSDINYFAKKYFYIISLDKGKCLINPYPKQCELLQSMQNYKRNIILASRQVGKSTTYSIYILWYILTNKDKHVLICANKLDTAIEILQRIQMAYQQLPMWLKPGVITWNKKKIEFSNGCSVTATATSESSGRGLSINCLVLDEFRLYFAGYLVGIYGVRIPNYFIF